MEKIKGSSSKKIIITLCSLFVITSLIGLLLVPVYAGESSVELWKSYDFRGELSETSVMVSEVYCDGENLVVTIELNNPVISRLLEEKEYACCSIVYKGDSYITTESESIELQEEVGCPGIEGEFTGDGRFVGTETFAVSDIESYEGFPDVFDLHIRMKSMNLMIDGNEIKIPGNTELRYESTVISNRDEVVVYQIEKECNRHFIDRVVVTPVMITVYTSYPDIYGETVNYTVNTYSDLFPGEEVSRMGHFGKTRGLIKIPRDNVKDSLDIYVWDWSSLGNVKFTGRSMVEERAIVSAHVTIQ